MGAFRALLLLALLAAGGCFVAYAWTSRPAWRTRGLRLLGGTIILALIFFAVLFAQQLTGSR